MSVINQTDGQIVTFRDGRCPIKLSSGCGETATFPSETYADFGTNSGPAMCRNQTPASARFQEVQLHDERHRPVDVRRRLQRAQSGCSCVGRAVVRLSIKFVKLTKGSGILSPMDWPYQNTLKLKSVSLAAAGPIGETYVRPVLPGIHMSPFVD